MIPIFMIFLAALRTAVPLAFGSLLIVVGLILQVSRMYALLYSVYNCSKIVSFISTGKRIPQVPHASPRHC
jgi:hypothetical protein